ncbi:hypothetical protein EKK97_09785 [Billgrantia tianxiuensis]|uniref:Harpin HrpZ n=1 Tax=Billgrantia tianxiuensis TaxID=2497861 RepID=A0A6I6SQP1_9GAMM|nr:hypothetical protein [Halomonas tianxiuensis]QHC49835.1 hypothetical protein EKK97_09785 [Halomonas tianxiuensis]
MVNATLTISLPLENTGGLAQIGGDGGGAVTQPRGGQGGGGIGDLVDLLADALMQALFQKTGDGATFDDSGSNPLMEMVAKFMDQNPSRYGGPHDATGNVNSWQDELKEDNYFNKEELADFGQGLRDALTSVLEGSLLQMLGGVLSSIGNAISGLGGMGGGMAGGAMGGIGGGMVGGALGDALGSGVGGAVGSLGNQIGAGFGGGMPRDLSPMGQAGFMTGGSFVSHIGKTAVDSIGIEQTGFRFSEMDINGGQRFSIGAGDKEMAKEIGKYMDQNPKNMGPCLRTVAGPAVSSRARTSIRVRWSASSRR